MIKNKDIDNIKKPIVELDKSLDSPENRVFATQKLAKANGFLAKAGLPQKEPMAKSRVSKQQHLTSLQAELLRFYAINPTETQMQLLRDFLEKLVSNAFEPISAK